LIDFVTAIENAIIATMPPSAGRELGLTVDTT